MKKIALLFSLGLVLFIGCKTNMASNYDKKLIIGFLPKSNTNVSGTAVFTEKDGKVTLEAKVTGLKPGIHAIHIHEKSDCSAADGSSAGGHWNPTFKKHGKLGEGEAHKGDIGNFTADEFGNGTVIFTTDEWCIGCEDPSKDILGKGLIIHQDPDDYISQPTGNAGARVACLAIIK
ncbi:MAG: superoxide dismutase family protein [Flavobacterium sp.]